VIKNQLDIGVIVFFFSRLCCDLAPLRSAFIYVFFKYSLRWSKKIALPATRQARAHGFFSSGALRAAPSRTANQVWALCCVYFKTRQVVACRIMKNDNSDKYNNAVPQLFAAGGQWSERWRCSCNDGWRLICTVHTTTYNFED
jgi:hypothetical protein